MKRILSALLIIALVLAAVPSYAISVSAESDEIYTYYVYDGAAYITDVDASLAGAVTVPDTLDGCPVTFIENEAFSYCKEITSVVLPDTVKYIADYAFWNCEKLTEIVLSANLDSFGYGVFLNCYNLQNITMTAPNDYFATENGVLFRKFSDGTTELVWYPAGKPEKEYVFPEHVSSIDDIAFMGSTLESIILSDNVRYIYARAFYNCTNLKNIALGTSLERISEESFGGCTALKSVVIPDTVTRIEDKAFENCTVLESVIYNGTPEFFGEDIFKGTAIFNNDDNYEDGLLYIGNNLLAAKKEISGEVNIKEGTTAIASEAFMNCTKIKNISIPESVVTIGYGAFWGCTSLEAISVPNGVTEIEDFTFFECSSLKEVNLGNGVTDIGRMAFASCTSIEQLIIPNSVENIGENAFQSCTGLVDLIIGEGIAYLGGYAFVDCTSLKNITIPKNLIYIGEGTFNLCENITYVFYRGSRADRERLNIISDQYLTDATWRYNSCIGDAGHIAAVDGNSCMKCGKILSKRGDLNGDDEINTTDLAIIKLFLAGTNELDELGSFGADFNDDGTIDTTDLANLKLELAGI